jgi:hypothetical protein
MPKIDIQDEVAVAPVKRSCNNTHTVDIVQKKEKRQRKASLEVDVQSLSGEFVCRLVDVKSDKEHEVFQHIAKAIGHPAMAQDLCVGNRKFGLTDFLDERSSKSLVKALIRMEKPVVQLLKKTLADAIRIRPDLLFEDAQMVDAGEACRLLDNGFVGAVLDFLEDDIDNIEDEMESHIHGSAVWALERVLSHRTLADTDPCLEQLKRGSDKLRNIGHDTEECWPRSVSGAARAILRKHLGEDIPDPYSGPDLRYVSIENGGSWNPGRYGIMPDECI